MLPKLTVPSRGWSVLGPHGIGNRRSWLDKSGHDPARTNRSSERLAARSTADEARMRRFESHPCALLPRYLCWSERMLPRKREALVSRMLPVCSQAASAAEHQARDGGRGQLLHGGDGVAGAVEGDGDQVGADRVGVAEG
jgi:hypothetical protein